jgi:glucose/arabinose dehydrogenase
VIGMSKKAGLLAVVVVVLGGAVALMLSLQGGDERQQASAIPTTTPSDIPESESPQGEDSLLLPPQTVAAGAGTILIDLQMPDGYKLNAQAPLTAIWPDDPVAQIPPESRDLRLIAPQLPVQVPVTFAPGQTDLALNLTVYWCEAVNETLCFVDRATLVLPLTVSSEGDAHEAVFARTLVPPVVVDTPG